MFFPFTSSILRPLLSHCVIMKGWHNLIKFALMNYPVSHDKSKLLSQYWVSFKSFNENLPLDKALITRINASDNLSGWPRRIGVPAVKPCQHLVLTYYINYNERNFFLKLFDTIWKKKEYWNLPASLWNSTTFTTTMKTVLEFQNVSGKLWWG